MKKSSFSVTILLLILVFYIQCKPAYRGGSRGRPLREYEPSSSASISEDSNSVFGSIVQDIAADEDPASVQYKQSLLEDSEEKGKILYNFFRFHKNGPAHGMTFATASNLFYAGLIDFPPSQCWKLASNVEAEYGPAFNDLLLRGRAEKARQKKEERDRRRTL